MQTIDLKEWPALIDLERAFYEKRSYENLLAYMADSGVGNTQEYFKEYIEVIKDYSQLCKRLENEIILPTTHKPVPWEVNFNEQTVTIKEDAN